MKTAFYCLFLAFILPNAVSAQIGMRDSSIQIASFGFGYQYSQAFESLIDRVDYTHQLNPFANYKLSRNIVLELGGHILLGDYNDYQDLIKGLNSDSGFPIDQNGLLVEINTQFFGYALYGGLAKIWNIWPRNPNSGIIVGIESGFIQHKINYVFGGQDFPALQGEYVKGYDRLSNGFYLAEKLGIRYYSLRNYLSFEIGFRLFQGFTQNRRSWDMVEMRKIDEPRTDMQIGAYASLIIPIFR